MEVIKTANLAVRFLLELCALAALAYWGFTIGGSQISKIGLGIGAPLVAAVAWGAFVAPGAPVSVSNPVRLMVEVVVFGCAVAALYAAGRPTLAGALGLAYGVNRVLMAVWGQ